ncbi:hypothetical protein XO10_09240 [Marinitoga sp. 1135]|uniref:1-acyl-sn-glycerol-3-phosphate acyltransferase n=1 Tax=Marinitoga piezophila (strain DSM 14283 / JCM 11233 / KA3) TaxID=443254 RepID=H2J6A3_MARPK|nr:lysophospholipid acyltransferase family protein [Marinitoga piezophila]AEX86251.1 1-acyl-sn-glycerol-3-phosphate acyltransferase [Marinitoga piezophila KA3]NUU96431.1 hypothetical protein [Marinitoga sp. 1135]NUU98352.1 hypothetical protein [Marinitoga sp. 1138]
MNKIGLFFKRILLTIWFYLGLIWYVGIYGTWVIIRSKIIEKTKGKEKAEEYIINVLKKFGKNAFKLMGVKVYVESEFDLSQMGDEAYMIVANHQSLLDIPLIIGYVFPTAFIAKKELSKVPIVSFFIKALGSVFIERGNATQSAKALRELRKKLIDGQKLVLFPEGTRTLDGEVKPFKRGSLMIPYRYKVKILPVAIDGAYEIAKKGRLYITPHPINITIFKPVNPEEFGSEAELRDYIYKLIASKVNKKEEFEEVV